MTIPVIKDTTRSPTRPEKHRQLQLEEEERGNMLDKLMISELEQILKLGMGDHSLALQVLSMMGTTLKSHNQGFSSNLMVLSQSTDNLHLR